MNILAEQMVPIILARPLYMRHVSRHTGDKITHPLGRIFKLAFVGNRDECKHRPMHLRQDLDVVCPEPPSMWVPSLGVEKVPPEIHPRGMCYLACYTGGEGPASPFSVAFDLLLWRGSEIRGRTLLSPLEPHSRFLGNNYLECV